MEIHYFAVDGFDGQFFSCKRYGTMSPAACSRNFKAAPAAVQTGRLEGCIGCQIGQQHTDPTVSVEDQERASGFAYREICVRCRRSGDDAFRLIGSMRIVREHTICVSCFNREREVLRGRNAKGAKPKKWRDLFYARVATVADGGTRVEQFDHPVVDQLEAILTIMRRKSGPRHVIWTPPRGITRVEFC